MRCKDFNSVKPYVYWIKNNITGIKYFGGGPVVRVPFAWFHVCFTINYLPSKEAVRSSKVRMKHGGERNYSEKSTSTGR